MSGLRVSVPEIQCRDHSSVGSDDSSKRTVHSSLGYRQQAADLMAKIKRDVRSKRAVSTDTELPQLSGSHSHLDRSLAHSAGPSWIPQEPQRPHSDQQPNESYHLRSSLELSHAVSAKQYADLKEPAP